MPRLPSGVLHLPVGELETNCIVLAPREGASAVVVDPGGEGRRIAAELRRRGFDLGAVLLTHGHIDHAYGLPELLAVMGPAPILLHGEDRLLWEAMDPQAQFLGVPAPTLPDGIEEIEDAQIIEKAGWSLEVIHTPGHSPGSVVFFLPDRGLALSGDTLFHQGVGRTDLWGGSWESLMRSLRRVLALPDATMLLPGHGACTSVLEARRWIAGSGLMDDGRVP